MGKLSPQQRANLRCCASCEWIYKSGEAGKECPKCGFASYGARFVHGDRSYTYMVTQKPWFDRKKTEYCIKLFMEIEETNPIKKKKSLDRLRCF